MKEFIAKLFSEHNSTLQITLFDSWHFLYLFIIFGGCALLTVLLRGRSDAAKEKAIRIMAYLTIGFYIADFFIMPLSDSYSGISADKLPFHICTLMSVLAPLVQFNKHLSWLKTLVVTLAITSALMWMCYPGSALGGEPPFSYIIFQTFMFHGFLFSWGYLNVALGRVKLNIKHIWKEFALILFILVWSSFGNTIYPDNHNWFFVRESIFPFLKDEAMPFASVISVFAVCAMIYAIYYAVLAIAKNAQKQKSSRESIPALH